MSQRNDGIDLQGPPSWNCGAATLGSGGMASSRDSGITGRCGAGDGWHDAARGAQGGHYRCSAHNRIGPRPRHVDFGKLAHLVVLDKNPLENIRNTNTIRYVMKNGELFEGR
jgi:hypothetical protein